MFEDAPSSSIPRQSLEANGSASLDIVGCAGAPRACATSISDARRLVEMAGAYLNNRRVEDPERALVVDDLLAGRYVVLRKGRRDYHLLRAE